VLVHLDCTVPVARVRDELTRIVSRSKLWDRQVVNLQVTDAREGTIVLRADERRNRFGRVGSALRGA
jgi:hypothetical protein